MQFWDSSALLPLVVRQGELSSHCRQIFGRGELSAVAFLARIECQSALERLARQHLLSGTALTKATSQLEGLLGGFDHVVFTPLIERFALSLLRRHALRSLDAIQLGCALSVVTAVPTQAVDFVCCNRALCRAAAAEGLTLPIALDWSPT